LELATVLLPLLGYFFCMIAVLTAAGGVMIGLFNTSTSRVSHYPHPRPVIERNVTATNGEPRLFMVAPETKDGSLAKNIEAGSTEKADAKKSKPYTKVLSRQRNNYEGHGYTTANYSAGYRPGLDA
jgi:hypothetical protein